MPIGLLFWILMFIWAIFYCFWQFRGTGWEWGAYGNTVFLFVLFLLLGWGIFGAPIKG
jgi:hypothetical protein